MAGLAPLVADQRRELMAACATESDLDFAFRLQLEEAMAASIALLPSSSTSDASSSSAPPPPPPAPAAGDDEGSLSQIMRLQSLEFERFDFEKKESEQWEAERRLVAEELRRRAHDERFAREIQEMPNDEWEEWGDEFEKPIEQVHGKDEPPFRLYFKGMASQERVGGEWVQLVAFGVAVCDPSDKMVLKIQKPAPTLEATTCRELLETEALIEGLNAVKSLGIKRVNVFCDYRTLYYHVTGIWGTKKSKIAEAINQVRLLQSKFERCQMFLLPRYHLRFVFKLARDAIDSQIGKNVKDAAYSDKRETCIICLEVTDSSEMFTIDDCLHQFCFSCMKQHVEVQLLHGILPSCPHDGCNVKLSVQGARKFLPPKLLDIMAQRIKEASIPANEKVYCPFPKCSALMRISEAICPQQDSTSKILFDDASGLRKCIRCNSSFCIKCKVPWHERLSCYEYKNKNPNPRPEESKLQSLARQKLWRQCVKCNHMIELAEGCFHMTCRCGYEFCYTCGAEWKDKRATCSCPLWDEDNILYDDTEDEGSEDFNDDDDDYDDYDSDDDYQGGVHRDGYFFRFQ